MDNGVQSNSETDQPRFVCVTVPPTPFKVAKVIANDLHDLTGIAKEGELTWIDCSTEDLDTEALLVARKFGFSESMARNLIEHSYEAYEDNDIELGLVMPAIKVKELDVDVRPVVMMIKANLIITMHDKSITRLVRFSRYADIWLSKLPAAMPKRDKLTLVMMRLISVINERNNEQLRLIEDRADDISESMLDPNIHYIETGRYIFQVKHSLIIYLNALWRGLDVLNKLRFGDAELVSDHPKVLQQMTFMHSKQTKHIGLTEHVSSILISGTTVLQALYNNQLLIINNRMLMVMTWMTILGTAVMVPNTLATMFGFIFNPNVPGDLLPWALAMIILATLASTYWAYWWITRKMPMAESPERLRTFQA
jgi:magnesium transporter